MKRTSVMIITTILLTVAVFSCASLGRSETGDAPGEKDASVQNSPVLPDGWSYETEITHEGSRSQGSISRLFYRYNEIPEVFSLIVISGTAFEYAPMNNIWDHSGYILIDASFRFKSDPDQPVTAEDLHNGWYTSDNSQLKAGTPSGWVYVEAPEITAWCAPEKLPEITEIFSLKPAAAGPVLLKQE